MKQLAVIYARAVKLPGFFACPDLIVPFAGQEFFDRATLD